MVRKTRWSDRWSRECLATPPILVCRPRHCCSRIISEAEERNDDERHVDRVDVTFDYCLVNFYRDGNDYINFHADNEAKDVIASVSLGATRRSVVDSSLRFALSTPFVWSSSQISRSTSQRVWQNSDPKRKTVDNTGTNRCQLIVSPSLRERTFSLLFSSTSFPCPTVFSSSCWATRNCTGNIRFRRRRKSLNLESI